METSPSYACLVSADIRGLGPQQPETIGPDKRTVSLHLEPSCSPCCCSRVDLEGRCTGSDIIPAIIPAMTCLAPSSLLAIDPSTCQYVGSEHSCASHSLAMKEGGGQSQRAHPGSES